MKDAAYSTGERTFDDDGPLLYRKDFYPLGQTRTCVTPVIIKLSRCARYATVILLVVLVYWPAGFYPFSPLRAHTNGAISDPAGLLAFPTPGLGLSTPAPAWLARARENNLLELKVELRTHNAAQEHASLISLADSTGESNFSLGQHKGHLVVRWRSPSAAGRTLRSVYVGKVFDTAQWRTLQIRLSGDSLRVLVDNKVAAERAIAANPFPAWLPNARFAVGNRIEFFDPWQGEFRALLVGAGEGWTDLMAPGALTFPSPYTFVSSDRTRHLFSLDNPAPVRALIKDWVINTLGFLPLGIALVLSLPGRSRVLLATLGCLAVSLSIELTQIFLPWRVPSLQDVLLNTAGGWIGAILANLAVRLWMRRQRRLTTQSTPTP